MTPQEQQAEQQRLQQEEILRRQEEAKRAAFGKVAAIAAVKPAFNLVRDTLSGSTEAELASPAATAIPSDFSIGANSVPVSGNSFLENGVPDFSTSANPSAMGTEGTVTSSPLGSGVGLSTLQQILGGAAAIHGGYNLGKQVSNSRGRRNPVGGAISGAETGAGVGSFIPGVGPLVGGGVGAVVGGLLGLNKSGKHKDQYDRDIVRKNLQQAGALDEQFGLTLADGSKFNMGLDGGARAEYDFSGGRRPFEVKTESEFAHQAVGWANPIAAIITGGDAKLSNQYAGYFANAAMSNASSIEGVRANLLKTLESLKLDRTTFETELKGLFDAGRMSEGDYKAALYGIHTLFTGQGAVVKPWEEPAPQSAAPAAPEAAPKQVGNTKLDTVHQY